MYTTPLRLLQAIDLYLSRLERSKTAPEGHQQAAALAGDTLGLPLQELKVQHQGVGRLGCAATSVPIRLSAWALLRVQATLSSLRDDVEAYWQAGEGDSC